MQSLCTVSGTCASRPRPTVTEPADPSPGSLPPLVQLDCGTDTWEMDAMHTMVGTNRPAAPVDLERLIAAGRRGSKIRAEAGDGPRT